MPPSGFHQRGQQLEDGWAYSRPFEWIHLCRYQEKFYFNPGDTGFKVFKTKHAVIGVAICWDQWFPEAARAMALQGAEARPAFHVCSITTYFYHLPHQDIQHIV